MSMTGRKWNRLLRKVIVLFFVSGPKSHHKNYEDLHGEVCHGEFIKSRVDWLNQKLSLYVNTCMSAGQLKCGIISLDVLV